MTKKKGSLKKRQATFNKAFVLTWICTFIAGVMIFAWSERYPVVWRYSMFMNAPTSLVLASIAMIVCIIVPLHMRLRNYLFECCFAFSLLLCLTQAGLIANGMLDKSTLQSRNATIVSKTSRFGYRTIGYYIETKDWRSVNGTVQFPVTEAHYETIQIGDTIQVTTKSGFLGYEWVVNKSQIVFGSP